MIFRLGELFCGSGGLVWRATHPSLSIVRIDAMV